MEGERPGEYEIHWPPLFPNIWLAECELLQLDVTIRPEPAPHVPYGDDDDDDDEYYDSEDEYYHFEDDYNGSDNYNDCDDDYDFC
ncbi:unnamed protein product [Rotaria sp. Silwood1]|nr:unnamed protein product [Rotaria sp. Silwood1]CAF4618080.1 unnamed protein product [Rotaria sp. Silwood1]